MQLNIWVGEITQNLVPSLWRDRKVTFHFYVSLVLNLLATGTYHTHYPVKCPGIRLRVPGGTHKQYGPECGLWAGDGSQRDRYCRTVTSAQELCTFRNAYGSVHQYDLRYTASGLV